MLIHVANKRTLITKCGRRVTKNIWWVSVSEQKKIPAGVRHAHGANCKNCLEK